MSIGSTSLRIYDKIILERPVLTLLVTLATIVFFLIYYFLRNPFGNHALLLAQLSFFGIRGIVQTIYYKTAILERFFK